MKYSFIILMFFYNVYHYAFLPALKKRICK